MVLDGSDITGREWVRRQGFGLLGASVCRCVFCVRAAMLEVWR